MRHDELTHAVVTLRIPRGEVATVAGLLREAYGQGGITVDGIRRWERMEGIVRQLETANDDTDGQRARAGLPTWGTVTHRPECHLHGTGERHDRFAPCNPTGGQS
jgi:hypothetical protein